MKSSALLFLAVCLVVFCGCHAAPKTSGSKKPSSKPSSVVEVEEELEIIAKEGKPKSMEGWLTGPTEAPQAAKLESRELVVAPKKAKSGFCGTPKSYGIKCMFRIDQCMEDHQCPSVSKCCMVGACGYMCVKPKPTEEVEKEDVKPELRKKDKKVSTTTTEAYDETNESLKASDVIDMKDMKDMKDLIIVDEKADKKKPVKEGKKSEKSEEV